MSACVFASSPFAARQAGTGTLTLSPLASPAPEGSAQPQLTVSPRGVLLSWIEQRGSRASLRFSERTSTGWTPPRTVAEGNDWFVNWADVPSVLRLSNGTLAAHWLQKSGADTYAYDVRLATSRDDGRTWSAPFSPHDDGTKTEHGFVSLFEMPDAAGLGLVWLDGRETAGGGGHGAGDAHASQGAMTVRFAAYDAAWKRTADTAIDRRVCDCCPTTAAVTRDGPIVAFRDRSAEEVRDISVSRLAQGKWTEPALVHADGWTIPACPVNGPMLSAQGANVAIAWFTAKDDVGRAFVAFSGDGGRTFGRPVRVDDASSLGRVDVELLPDNSAIVTWVEFADQRAQFRARRVRATGERSPSSTISTVAGSRASGYPRLARNGRELVFAWTESLEKGARVRTVSADVGIE